MKSTRQKLLAIAAAMSALGLAQSAVPGYAQTAPAAMGEPSVNFLQEVGIRARLRPLERAAFTAGFGEKKLRGLILATSGAAGNAATRLESFAVSGSRYAYGTYPDIDGLFAEQVNEQNPRVRKQLLDRAQQIID